MPLERTKHVNGRMWQPGPSGNPNGRPSRLSGCPKFSGATSRRETLSRSRVVFRGCSAAWADLYSLPGFFAFVTAVDRMGCWSPCPAARQRRLLLRAGVVASGHVTALDPPRGPYLPREVSAAAAGQPRKRGRTGERIRFCFGRGRLHGGCGVSPTCCGAILCRRGRLHNVSSLSGHWRGARRISRLRHEYGRREIALLAVRIDAANQNRQRRPAALGNILQPLPERFHLRLLRVEYFTGDYQGSPRTRITRRGRERYPAKLSSNRAIGRK
jgi:hypothetical protein